METNKDILEARKKFAEKCGDIKLGGKGNHFSYLQVLKEEIKSLTTEAVLFKTKRSPLLSKKLVYFS